MKYLFLFFSFVLFGQHYVIETPSYNRGITKVEQKNQFIEIENFKKEKDEILNLNVFSPDEDSQYLSNSFINLFINNEILQNVYLPNIDFKSLNNIKEIEIIKEKKLPEGNRLISLFSYNEPRVAKITFKQSGELYQVDLKNEKDYIYYNYNFSYKNKLLSSIEFNNHYENRNVDFNIYYSEHKLILNKENRLFEFFEKENSWENKLIGNLVFIDNKNFTIEKFNKLNRLCYNNISILELNNFKFNKNKQICKLDYDTQKLILKDDLYNQVLNIKSNEEEFSKSIDYQTKNLKKITKKYVFDDNNQLKTVLVLMDGIVYQKWNLIYTFYK